MAQDTERFSLKDHLFNRPRVQALAGELKRVYPRLNRDQFTEEVLARFPELELKQRIEHITDCLTEHLPKDYRKAVGVILKALPPPLDPSLKDDDFGQFIHEPYNRFIARHGAAEQDLQFSLDAIEQTTQRFSAEFAIRTFIREHQDATLARIHEWTTHPHYHVRRLASEGTRLSLPWAGKIPLERTAVIGLLDQLHTDSTRYVTRSVANSLNDISKIDSDLVLETLGRWKKANRQDPRELEFMIRHALRTRIKAGETKVMTFLGYNPKAKFRIKQFSCSDTVTIGDALHFGFEFIPAAAGSYMIDYLIHFVRKDGSTGRKTFKLKDAKLDKGQALSVTKKHPLRVMTTRTLYPGEHIVQLQVNGKALAEHPFTLEI